ncbi:MAG: hypothetical protein ABI333_19635 [bacterium]
MSSRPFVPDKPLVGAVLAALDAQPSTVLVVGSPRVARALRRAGHAVTLWTLGGAGEAAAALKAPLTWRSTLEHPPPALDRYEALVLVNVLGRRVDPQGDLRRLVREARPGALVLAAEQAAFGQGGRMLSRWFGRLLGRTLLMEPSELAAVFLNAGLSGLRQSWPQGLRSLVLIRGRVHRLARVLDPGDADGH